MTSIFDFLRILCVFSAVFLMIPLLVSSSSFKGSWYYRLAAGFVRVCFFFEATILILGICNLGLPGGVVLSYTLWTLSSGLYSYRKRILASSNPLQRAFLQLQEALERSHSVALTIRGNPISRQISVSPFTALFLLLIAATLLQRAWYPLHNFRFAGIDNYSRALSLELLTQGQAWRPDGSVALLAPLVHLSGLSVASVIRFAGPLFSTLLVLSAGLSAFRVSQMGWAAFLACGFTAILPIFASSIFPIEITGAEMAALFYMLAFTFLWLSQRDAAFAAVTGFLVYPHINVAVLGVIGCSLAALGVARASRYFPKWTLAAMGGLAATAFTFTLCAQFQQQSPEGPYQYEAAAKACSAIDSQFRKNEWLIVSPVHELAYTSGRGWHVELVDFIESFRTAQVSDPAFQFPYPARNTFFFIEKEPLRGNYARMDLTQDIDRVLLAYHAPLGRASVQFQAAALIAAYRHTHQDLSVFYEDDHLIIYRVTK